MAHPKQESLRRRYGFCCGYCGVSETDAGGELTVDHFRPVSKGGDDSDDNLVYACIRCNQYKADFFPAESASEQRLLHPLLDDSALHFRMGEDGRLLALSTTGTFHITILRLNRPQLVERRVQKMAARLEAERTEMLEHMVGYLSVAIEELRETVRHLKGE